MKKIHILTVAFTMLFVGCAKVNEDTPKIIKNEEPIVEATEVITAIAPAETKTTIDGLNVKWATSDALTIFDTDAGAHEFTLETGAGTASGTFEGTFEGKTAGTYALYPHNASNALATNAATVIFPSTYTYGTAPTPLLGTNVGEDTFSFQHIGGVLRIAYSNAPDFATTFEIESAADICGAYTITDVTSGMDGSFTSGAKKVTITDLPGTSDLEFFIPLPAGDYTFTVRLKRGDNVITASQKTVGSAKTISAGKMKTLGAINLPDIVTVTKTMTQVCGTTSENPNGTKITPFSLDATITVTTDGSGGKAYGTEGNRQVNFYENSKDHVIVNAATGYELVSLTIVWSVNTNYGNIGITSNTATAISGSSVSYPVGHSEGSSTGSIKVTSISVSYIPTGSSTASTKVSTPEITFSNNIVSITCATEGATIYYTDNGDTPTTSSAVYSSPINISEDKTFKAIACKDHMQNSDIASKDCSHITPLSAPASLTISSINSTTLEASWANDASATGYSWIISTAKTDDAITVSNTIAEGTQSDAVLTAGVYTLTKTELSLNGVYYIYVKALGNGTTLADSPYSKYGAANALSFSFSSNPTGWPTGSTVTEIQNIAAASRTYTMNGVSYTFDMSVGIGYHTGTPALWFTKSADRYMGLPQIDNFKLTKVSITTRNDGSDKSVAIATTSSGGITVSGGAEKTLVKNATTTWTLTGTTSAVYYIYCASNGQNAAVTTIALEYTYFTD